MLKPALIAALSLALGQTAAAWELKVCADPAGAPYSTHDRDGFDNRIAAILAEELGVRAEFVWMPNRRLKTARGHLHAGDCDAVMGVLDGQNGYFTSHAYYRSAYVFVQPVGAAPVASLDDAALAGMRIGVPGGARRTTPPAVSLARRGRMDNLVFYGANVAAGETERAILMDLEAGRIDLAILWGPVAGDLVGEGLTLRPVAPEIDIPFLPMFAALSIGVRPHDEALRDALDHALAVRWSDVQAVLTEARVPLLHLPRPQTKDATQ